MVLVPLVGAFAGGMCIGWASTPYSLAWEQRFPRRAAWMAAAGPGANFAIALLALLALRTGLGLDVFAAADSVNYGRYVVSVDPFADNIGRFLSILLTLNVFLGLFNLLPIPPLDGASVLTLVLGDDLGARLRAVSRTPGVSMIGFLGLMLMFRYAGRVFDPGFAFLLRLVHPEFSYA